MPPTLMVSGEGPPYIADEQKTMMPFTLLISEEGPPLHWWSVEK